MLEKPLSKTASEFAAVEKNLPEVNVSFWMDYPLRKKKRFFATIYIQKVEVTFELNVDLWNLIAQEEQVDGRHNFAAKRKIRMIKGAKHGGYGIREYYRVDLPICNTPLIVISSFLNDEKIVFIKKETLANGKPLDSWFTQI